MFNFACLPPLAALEDILSVVVPLIFLIFWVLGQMGESKKKAAAKAEARRRQRQPVPAGLDAQMPKKAGPAPADQADPLRQQVEAMLREAGYGTPDRPSQMPPDEPKAHGSASRDSTIEVLVDGDPAAAEVIPAGSDRQAENIRLPRVAPSMDQEDRERLVPQAARSVKTESLIEQASHLGDDIVVAEDKLESSVRAKFANELGTLKDTHDGDAYKQRSNENIAASHLASLLRNPKGVREAIILSEILNRPIDRW